MLCGDVTSKQGTGADANMLKKQGPKFVFIIAFFLLIANGVQGTGFWLYQQPRKVYINYKMDKGPDELSNGPVPAISISLGEEPPQQRSNAQLQGSPVANRMQAENKFVFPDSTSGHIRPGPAPICKGSTFCVNVPNYPTDFVNKAIMNDKKLQNYENVDVLDSISQRAGDVDAHRLCRAKEQVIYPQSAETINKDWLYILNQQNFSQGVRVELCREEGQACRLVDGFAEGYTTHCVQKYIFRELTAITSDGTIGPEFFRFPASCCCNAKFNGAISRFGSIESPGIRNIRATT